MIMQLVVIALVAFIAYWWASQGALSALLHLACVVAAGAVAFGVWELATIKGLFPLHEFFHTSGWAIGLLIPFAVSLVVFRLLTDKIVRANLALNPNVNWAVGAIFGAGAGILTTGIVLIGVGHLQVPPKILGFQRYVQDATSGVIADGAKLWIPADSLTEKFYGLLSGGAFATSQPLAVYRPQVAAEATLLRVSFDSGMSRNSMQPGDASVSRLIKVEGSAQEIYDYGDQRGWSYSDPFNGRVAAGDGYIVVVDFTASARERSGGMAVGNAQFCLVGQNSAGEATPVFPISVIAQAEDSGNPLGRFRFQSSDFFVASIPGESRPTMGFEFILPQGFEPLYFMARGLRLELPSEPPDTISVASRNRAIAAGNIISGGGQRYVDDADFNTDNMQRLQLSGRDGAIVVSSSFPGRWTLLRDQLSGLRDNEDRQIDGGKQTIRVEILEERKNRQLAIDEFFQSPGEQIVRAEVTSLPFLKPPPTNNSANQVPLLIDSNGNQYVAIGYIFVERGMAEFSFDVGEPILSLGQLPASLSAQRTDQQLFLIFNVRKNITLQRLSYGPEVRAEFQLVISGR
jgi:hypothetical protein